MPSNRIVVLLVDDQALVGAAFEQMLAAEPDVELRCCLLAADAIALANEIDPTVILLDLVMPDVDGLTLIRSFRTNPRTAGTPVIVLSGHDDEGTRARARAEGANGFLVTLPPKHELLAVLREHAARSAAGKDTLDPEAMDLFHDVDAPDFTRDLIDQFVREAHDCVRTLQDAGARWDPTVLKATAHRLKGSAAIMGAARLAALCSQVEDQVAAPTGHGVAELVAELDREFVRVQLALIARRDALMAG
jgi:DNA-binding NarL/FixJ family response regulator